MDTSTYIVINNGSKITPDCSETTLSGSQVVIQEVLVSTPTDTEGLYVSFSLPDSIPDYESGILKDLSYTICSTGSIQVTYPYPSPYVEGSASYYIAKKPCIHVPTTLYSSSQPLYSWNTPVYFTADASYAANGAVSYWFRSSPISLYFNSRQSSNEQWSSASSAAALGKNTEYVRSGMTTKLFFQSNRYSANVSSDFSRADSIFAGDIICIPKPSLATDSCIATTPRAIWKYTHPIPGNLVMLSGNPEDYKILNTVKKGGRQDNTLALALSANNCVNGTGLVGKTLTTAPLHGDYNSFANMLDLPNCNIYVDHCIEFGDSARNFVSCSLNSYRLSHYESYSGEIYSDSISLLRGSVDYSIRDEGRLGGLYDLVGGISDLSKYKFTVRTPAEDIGAALTAELVPKEFLEYYSEIMPKNHSRSEFHIQISSNCESENSSIKYSKTAAYTTSVTESDIKSDDVLAYVYNRVTPVDYATPQSKLTNHVGIAVAGFCRNNEIPMLQYTSTESLYEYEVGSPVIESSKTSTRLVSLPDLTGYVNDNTLHDYSFSTVPISADSVYIISTTSTDSLVPVSMFSLYHPYVGGQFTDLEDTISTVGGFYAQAYWASSYSSVTGVAYDYSRFSSAEHYCEKAVGSRLTNCTQISNPPHSYNNVSGRIELKEDAIRCSYSDISKNSEFPGGSYYLSLSFNFSAGTKSVTHFSNLGLGGVGLISYTNNESWYSKYWEGSYRYYSSYRDYTSYYHSEKISGYFCEDLTPAYSYLARVSGSCVVYNNSLSLRIRGDIGRRSAAYQYAHINESSATLEYRSSSYITSTSLSSNYDITMLSNSEISETVLEWNTSSITETCGIQTARDLYTYVINRLNNDIISETSDQDMLLPSDLDEVLKSTASANRSELTEYAASYFNNIMLSENFDTELAEFVSSVSAEANKLKQEVSLSDGGDCKARATYGFYAEHLCHNNVNQDDSALRYVEFSSLRNSLSGYMIPINGPSVVDLGLISVEKSYK